MTTRTQGTVDPLDLTHVLDDTATASPRVSLYIPTPDTGPQASIAADILRSQIKDATAGLVAAGLTEADAGDVLAPAAQLVEDSTWWREQSRGLVIFAARGYHEAFRVPVEVTESVTVGDTFHVLPLARVLDTTGNCYILTVSKNRVQLFDATRNTIKELPLGTIPASFDDVIDEIPEKQLQAHTSGAGDISFHGHADSNDTEWMLTEEFLRDVGTAVGKELGTARSQPLVLAAVAEYLPAFRNACPYPAIHDSVIPGNHDRTQPDELRSAAWSLLGDKRARGEAEERERALSLAHNGRGSFDIAEIRQAAGQGRVDTLYLPVDVTDADSPAVADAAVLDTLRARGSVRVPVTWDGDHTAVATFRH